MEKKIIHLIGCRTRKRAIWVVVQHAESMRLFRKKSPGHTPHFLVARDELWRSSHSAVCLTDADEDDTIWPQAFPAYISNLAILSTVKLCQLTQQRQFCHAWNQGSVTGQISQYERQYIGPSMRRGENEYVTGFIDHICPLVTLQNVANYWTRTSRQIGSCGKHPKLTLHKIVPNIPSGKQAYE
jgi:hypothetical protein